MSTRLGTAVESFGATRAGVWAIKNVVSPVQRWVHRASHGRLSVIGSAPVLLLTTTGRRSGQPRTIPAFYLADGPVFVLCNVRPPGERVNPWVLNIGSCPDVTLDVRGRTVSGRARPATENEAHRYWPRLVELWPAYERFVAAGGERHVVIVEPYQPATPVATPRRSRSAGRRQRRTAHRRRSPER